MKPSDRQGVWPLVSYRLARGTILAEDEGAGYALSEVHKLACGTGIIFLPKIPSKIFVPYLRGNLTSETSATVVVDERHLPSSSSPIATRSSGRDSSPDGKVRPWSFQVANRLQRELELLEISLYTVSPSGSSCRCPARSNLSDSFDQRALIPVIPFWWAMEVVGGRRRQPTLRRYFACKPHKHWLLSPSVVFTTSC